MASETVTKQERGWWYPLNSRKAHYFNGEFQSLCRRWAKFGDAQLHDDNHDSPDNCRECQKKRAALASAPAQGDGAKGATDGE